MLTNKAPEGTYNIKNKKKRETSELTD